MNTQLILTLYKLCSVTVLCLPPDHTRSAGVDVSAADPAGSFVQVGTPVTAAIRYREGAQLAALGLSPYAGAAFHGPPLLLAGARLLDAAAASAFPGFSVLAPPWRVLATSAADVLAAAALARLAAAAAARQPGTHGSSGAQCISNVNLLPSS